jgi:hypothetical protein
MNTFDPLTLASIIQHFDTTTTKTRTADREHTNTQCQEAFCGQLEHVLMKLCMFSNSSDYTFGGGETQHATSVQLYIHKHHFVVHSSRSIQSVLSSWLASDYATICWKNPSSNNHFSSVLNTMSNERIDSYDPEDLSDLNQTINKTRKLQSHERSMVLLHQKTCMQVGLMRKNVQKPGTLTHKQVMRLRTAVLMCSTANNVNIYSGGVWFYIDYSLKGALSCFIRGNQAVSCVPFMVGVTPQTLKRDWAAPWISVPKQGGSSATRANWSEFGNTINPTKISVVLASCSTAQYFRNIATALGSLSSGGLLIVCKQLPIKRVDIFNAYFVAGYFSYVSWVVPSHALDEQYFTVYWFYRDCFNTTPDQLNTLAQVLDQRAKPSDTLYPLWNTCLYNAIPDSFIRVVQAWNEKAITRADTMASTFNTLYQKIEKSLSPTVVESMLGAVETAAALTKARMATHYTYPVVFYPSSIANAQPVINTTQLMEVWANERGPQIRQVIAQSWYKVLPQLLTLTSDEIVYLFPAHFSKLSLTITCHTHDKTLLYCNTQRETIYKNDTEGDCLVPNCFILALVDNKHKYKVLLHRIHLGVGDSQENTEHMWHTTNYMETGGHRVSFVYTTHASVRPATERITWTGIQSMAAGNISAHLVVHNTRTNCITRLVI